MEMRAINDLRLIMRRWTSGVVIVTSSGGGHVHGMTASSFTSVSLDPPMITVTIAHPSQTHTMIQESGLIGITLLAEDQQGISELFAGHDNEAKAHFLESQTFTASSGVPLIRGGMGYLDCAVVHQFDMPFSTLFVAEIRSMAKEEDSAPLVYFNREYYRITK